MQKFSFIIKYENVFDEIEQFNVTKCVVMKTTTCNMCYAFFIGCDFSCIISDFTKTTSCSNDSKYRDQRIKFPFHHRMKSDLSVSRTFTVQ